jgi:hypothetical protein
MPPVTLTLLPRPAHQTYASRLAHGSTHCIGHVRGCQQHLSNSKYFSAHATLICEDSYAKGALGVFGYIQHKLVNIANIQKIIPSQQ